MFKLSAAVITHILKRIGLGSMKRGILFILFGGFLAGNATGTTGAIITKKIQKK